MVVKIKCEILSKDKFKPYGSILSPEEEVCTLSDKDRNANQGTAIKINQVSDITYGGPNKSITPNINFFRCFTQPHLKRCFSNEILNDVTHTVKLLEQHPLSSQTFIPLGGPINEYSYLVIVALPNKQESNEEKNVPDITTLKSFLCKGNQAITYGKGVWHAPMIVVGDREFLDFAVVIYETLDPNKPELDCVERVYDTPETEILITF